jgi:hypothetical protein
MNKNIPIYVSLDKLNSPISFEWDERDPYSIVGLNNYETEQKLSQITNYGKFVFSLGCAEWVVSRFSHFLEDDLPWQYLHACWAFELSDNYLLPYELDDSEWTGKILEPICLALTTVINTRYGFDEDNAETDSAFSEKLALHVIPKLSINLFHEWKCGVLENLIRFYSVENGNITGKRVPIEILNPSFSIENSKISSLIESSLKKINLANNCFIHPNSMGSRSMGSE